MLIQYLYLKIKLDEKNGTLVGGENQNGRVNKEVRIRVDVIIEKHALRAVGALWLLSRL